MNTQEIWKPVAECNGEYYVSSWGRVKSLKFGKERILKPSLIGNGYRAVLIHLGKKVKCHTIHKLVALAFIPNPDNKPQVNHKDGDKLNNHMSNLEWLTAKENTNHAWSTGLCEFNRNASSMRRKKPVLDLLTQKKYNSLLEACIDINEPYARHQARISNSYKTIRFIYL